MESKELTVKDVAALVVSTRTLLARFGGNAFSRAKVHDAILKINGGDVSSVSQTAEAIKERGLRYDELANELQSILEALIAFERAPAGVGRAGAGKR